jgi:hypothetical protein
MIGSNIERFFFFTIFGKEKIDIYIAKKKFRIEKSTFYRNLSHRKKKKSNDKFDFTIIFSDIFFTDTSEFADILSRIPILSRKIAYRYASKITLFLTVFYRYESENKNEIDKRHHFQASPCCGRGGKQNEKKKRRAGGRFTVCESQVHPGNNMKHRTEDRSIRSLSQRRKTRHRLSNTREEEKIMTKAQRNRII